MKRFYKNVSVAEVAPAAFEILLDGKPVRSPSRRKLVAPDAALANAVAGEWQSQIDTIRPDDMPLTQLLITVLDRVQEERSAMEATILGYLATDLLCYRASPPAPIAARQAELWDPWLDWFALAFDARLPTTTALSVLTPDAAIEARVASRLQALDDMRFGALQLVVSLTGSLVLGLAALEGAATPEQIFAALNAEEDFKAVFYREDFHGYAPHEEKRRAHTLRDLKAAALFIALQDGVAGDG